jgi:long-chain fatty acid transport protein
MCIPGRLRALCAALLPLLPITATATNGMNMEGYGPVAAAMGGASMAYDNGSAAMMNNPATIGLMDEGGRLDLFFGFLGPDVQSERDGMTAKSSGTAYYMPALGYVRKHDGLAYGLGLYGQGGMGTEYGTGSFLGAGLENRTELSVGRIIAPLSYDVNDRLVLGGSVDFVWAGLDLRMAMNGAQFTDLVTTQQGGAASGSLIGAYNAAPIDELHYAYFDYSNHNRFSGKARGYGAAGKIGATFKVDDRLTLGASYHSKTRLGDMKTDEARILMAVDADFGGGSQRYEIPVSGSIRVKDFQWPSTWAVGAAFQATDRLLLVGDIKRINWADTMEQFRMVFTADSHQTDPLAAGFAGLELDAALFQRWEDQTVYQVGGAYQMNRQLILRAGFNYASNPVPDQYLNALFPAIVERHVTAGFGYGFNEAQSIDFSLQHATEVTATNPNTGVTSRHSQTSFQFIYSQRF